MANLDDRSLCCLSSLDIHKEPPLKVLKFGGTSVGSIDQLKRVIEIIKRTAETHRVVVVASAASGVTDTLVAALQAIDHGQFSREALVDGLWARYHVLATGLLQPESLLEYEDQLQEILDAHIRALDLTFITTPALRDHLLALGERLSVPLVALALRDAGLHGVAQDATTLIRTDDTFGDALVDVFYTYRQIRAWHGRLASAAIPVVTGFLGATPSGTVTTLGRGGSDYTAALLAAALRVSVLERWTDVDGLYTADPRVNEKAERIDRINLEEAWAWNRAKDLGMHRKVLDPLVEAEVPAHVCCTTRPDATGTWILPAGYEDPIAAVAS